MEQLRGKLDSIIDGLLDVTCRAPVAPQLAANLPAPINGVAGSAGAVAASSVWFASAHALGHAWSLTELSKELGLSDLCRVFRCARHGVDVEALIRIMCAIVCASPTTSWASCAGCKPRPCTMFAWRTSRINTCCRRYVKFTELLGRLQKKFASTSVDITVKVAWNALPLEIAHNRQTACQQQQERKSRSMSWRA